MDEKLLKIFKQAFGLDHIDDSMSIDSIDGWDSMAHVGLMMALQTEYKVSIAPADAIEMTDVAGIKKFLKAQGIE